jgi:hypothetical protein
VGINTATPVAGVALHVCDNVFGANLSSGVRFGNSGNNYYFDQLIVTDGSANPSYQLKFTNQTLSKYLFGGGANYWEWYANNTLGMTLNSTGLGVGAVPSVAGENIYLRKDQAAYTSIIVQNNNALAAGTGCGFTLNDGGVNAGWFRRQRDGTGNTDIGYKDSLRFRGAITGTERTDMTLDASGNLSVGATAVLNGVRIFCQRSGGSVAGFNRTTSDGTNVLFYREGLIVGDVSVTTTGTTFNSTSDYRLKESVAPLSGGLARVNSLKPSIYKWKSNGSDGEGFLAHELAEVVPAAVSGQKDAVNEDGTIKAQSIDMSRIVPILVAAIQELTAEVNALKNA